MNEEEYDARVKYVQNRINRSQTKPDRFRVSFSHLLPFCDGFKGLEPSRELDKSVDTILLHKRGL